MAQSANWLSSNDKSSKLLKEQKQNWFFYWKSSPALWEEELLKCKQSKPILIPIHWSYHLLKEEGDGDITTMDSVKFDFGQFIHNGDLLKLSELCEKHHFEHYFMLSLTPASFLPCGGLPSFLARFPCKTQDNLIKAYLDRDSNIHKIYSYFDPKIYHFFRKFCFSLSALLKQNHVEDFKILTTEYGSIEDNQFHSYLEDYSQAFTKGFEKFCQYKKQVEKSEDVSASPKNIRDYQQQVLDLYSQSARDYLDKYYIGHLRLSMIGGSHWDLMKRSSNKWDYTHELFKVTFDALSVRTLPSLVLLSENILGHDLLTSVVGDLVTKNYFDHLIEQNKYADDEWGFSPLNFFKLFGGQYYTHTEIQDLIQKLGLKIFFNSFYRWSYSVHQEIQDMDEDEVEDETVAFFFGKFLNEKDLKRVFRQFFFGQTIILDLSHLNVELRSKFEIFIAENNFNREHVQYYSPIHCYKLGEGKLITFESTYLEDHSLKDRVQFWSKLSSFLEIENLSLINDDDVFCYWLRRKSNTEEFKYKEVRRVFLYNPTNEKKKVFIETLKSFAFLKHITDKDCVVQSKLSGVEIRLAPFSKSYLDYGVFDQG